MATGISEKMGSPHVEDSLSPWAWTNHQVQAIYACTAINQTTAGNHS